MKNKTVITGYGIVSCIGSSVSEVERNLRDAMPGLTRIPDSERYGLQCPYQGRKPSLPMNAIEAIPIAMRRTMNEESVWAALAVRQALDMARMKLPDHRLALIVSNDSTATEHHRINSIMTDKCDSRHLRSSTVFKSLNSTVSMNLAQIYNVLGLSFTISAACAGGGHAVGVAHSLIQSGTVDVAIVVGAQEMGPYAFTAFDALGVFSRHHDAQCASRPFDADRSGLVPSGGAACVILESALHAANRECGNIIASVDGYGFSTSGSIVTPDVEAIVSCMEDAIDNAGVDVNDIRLVAAHATGTRDGDRAEADAISRVFEDNDHYAVTATKALTGHECWMAGVSQLVYTLIQMEGGFIAPLPYGFTQDSDLPPLPLNEAERPCPDINSALLNAFGFGGTNSSIVISKF